MRPRLISRGNGTDSNKEIAARLGFNEAPADQPGKSMPHPAARPRWVRFNEAPADQPGKCHSSRSHREVSSRFNEAPADQPGKCRSPPSARW